MEIKIILSASGLATDRVEKNMSPDILWPHASNHMGFVLIFILLYL